MPLHVSITPLDLFNPLVMITSIPRRYSSLQAPLSVSRTASIHRGDMNTML